MNNRSPNTSQPNDKIAAHYSEHVLALNGQTSETASAMNIVTKDILGLVVPFESSPASTVDRHGLKQSILEACRNFERAVAGGDKGFLRALHQQARVLADPGLNARLYRLYTKRKRFFVDGQDLDPKKICPQLILVEPNSVWEDVFKIVRGTWSMPYSKGYGRRLRFIVYDNYHQAVIGILGYQSPAADLACRDALISVRREKKLQIVNSTLDVYTIGAIPPYSYLIGGKLVAGLAAATDVVAAYKKLYGGKRSEIDDVVVSGELIALTTASAFGRSSIYNRLKFKEGLIAHPIGYTKGYGAVHLEHLYGDMLRMLLEDGHPVSTGGFGVGPKIRWQNVTRALQAMNLPGTCLKHGLQRQVYLYPLVDNISSAFAGENPGASRSIRVDSYADFWKDRWALPRARSNFEWPQFVAEDFFATCFGKPS